MDTYRTVDYLVAQCRKLGVEQVFGVDGANIEDLFDAVEAHDTVTGVIAKHEAAAANMAEGYARVGPGIGVVAATSGAGSMNLVTGLAESFASHVAILALVGAPPTALAGRGAFQDTSGRNDTIDGVRLLREVSRYCEQVERAADLPDHLSAAVSAAQTGGPAVLVLPKDVQQARIARTDELVPQRVFDDDDALGTAAVVGALTQARRTGKIVIIAGDQVLRDDAVRQLHELAAVLDASVGVTPDAKAVYRCGDPGYLGVAGVMGHRELTDAVDDAALCLAVGTRLPVMAGIAIRGDTVLAGVGALPPYHDAVHARSRNLADTLSEIAVALGGTPYHSPRSFDVVPDAPRPCRSGYHDAMAVIAAALGKGDDIVADAGNTGAAAVHYLDATEDGRFLIALGMGGMGYGFGAAIGATFARRRRTYLVAGDGAFFMHGMEIHTAVEHRLPITFLVFNNNAHAMCVTREQLFHSTSGNRNRFRRSNLAAGVGAMFPSLPATRARTATELAEVLHRESDLAGPLFVEVDSDPDEIPPFVPFQTATTQGVDRD